MAGQLSSATDIESLRYSSWCLCRLLEREIGTKDEVAFRRKNNIMYYYTYNNDMFYTLLHSGSEAEGFNFLSSDVDLMRSSKYATVLEPFHSTRPDDDRMTVLLLTREGCNPGFGILRLLNRTNHRYIRKAIVDYYGHPVVSSLLYRDAHKSAECGQVANGPCNTFKHFKDLDLAHCLKCDMWPTEANEFIHRQRPHGWPQKSVLAKIISTGCHLVPIGDKDHDLSSIQWRLSFSAAEKYLVHSFNHTQFLVYGLMKIFLKQFINKFQSVKDLLCSYFLKTVMFYSIEGTPSSFWRDDVLIPCFWFCLNKLIYWVKQGYCPNYFVPQNNMFRVKISGDNQRNLLAVLNQCQHFGWTCVCLCKDLQLLEQFLNQPECLFTTGVIPNEVQQESYSDFITFVALARSVVVDPRYGHIKSAMRKNLHGPLTLLRHARTRTEEDISSLLLYSVLRYYGQVYAGINAGISNKNKYRESYRMLLMSAKSNMYTGCVYLATFYYITGQYRKTVYLCDRVISQWKPYVTYQSLGHQQLYNSFMYQKHICGRGISVLDKAKLANAFDIIMDPDTKGFNTAELGLDIEASAPFPVFIPAIPYTVFLLFLCHHKLGNIDQTVTALHDLQVLLHDSQQGCRQYPVMLNMLAVCQDKLGDVHGAMESCLHSQALKPSKNGSVKMLEKLIRKYC